MSANSAPTPSLQDLGIALLRIALGVVFIAHSAFLKVFVFTMSGTASFFEGLGLPGWFAYVVLVAETVGGVLLVLGVQARWAALALLPIALGATWAHSGNGWMFAYANGGWEYLAYLSVLCLAQFLLGDGAFALRRSHPIEMLFVQTRAAKV
ncbi:MAG TPA: DoxX family protein [Bradyrhizobium sp.]|jgi:putative oxidoreductase|nr:DoxX family protein [Bradyrhizobium sp.]